MTVRSPGIRRARVSVSSGAKRRLLYGAIVGAFATLLVGARAEAQDVFASSGPKYAAEGVRDHWLAGTDEFRSSSHCCLVWLQQGFAEQVVALAYYAAAREATNDERRELNRLGNEAIGRRTAYLNQFRDCTNAVQHALNVAKAGGDATGLMPAGCGRPKPDEFGSNGGLGPGVADDWFNSRIPDEVRDSAGCCKKWLRRATRKENKGLDAFWASQATGLSTAERNALRAEAQELISQRRKLLIWFSKCVHRVWDDLGDGQVCAATGPAGSTQALAGSSEILEAQADQQCDNSKGPLKGYVDSLDEDELRKAKITVDDAFRVADEPGVNWDDWYRDWIKLVKTQVWDPLRQHFCSDSHSYWVDVKYEVYNDHTIVYVIYHTEGTDNLNGRNYATTVQNFFDSRIQDHVPTLPVGTKYGTPTNPLKRTFHFHHNALGGEGVTLGGPPQG
jgi:hypothetical protein